jgi:hypothetical protein
MATIPYKRYSGIRLNNPPLRKKNNRYELKKELRN